MLNIEKDILLRNFPLSLANNCRSDFHKQLLTSWYSIYCIEPKIIIEILDQYILENRHINIGRKTITAHELKDCNPDLKIFHITDVNGKLLIYDQKKIIFF